MSGKKVVLLETSPDFTRLFDTLDQLNAKTYLFSTSGKVSTRENVTAILVNELSFKHISEKLKSLDLEVDLFLSFRDELVPLAALLNEQLSRGQSNTLSLDLAQNVKSKIWVRQRLAESPFNPDFAILSKGTLNQSQLPKFPAVVKPALGFASLGVKLVEEERALELACDEAWAVSEKVQQSLDERLQCPNADELLVESFVFGPEVSVEVFCDAKETWVLGICGKTPMRAPYFEEESFMMPADLTADELSILASAAQNVCSALGVKNACGHLEFILSKDGPKLLDVGLRIGGGGLSDSLVHHSTGIDFIGNFLEYSLDGRQPDFTSIKNNTALLYLMQVKQGGVVRNIGQPWNGGDCCKLHAAVCWIKEGAVLTGYPHHSGLPGYAIYEINGESETMKTLAQSIVTKNQEQWTISYEP